MEGSALAADHDPVVYHCPGESHAIDRAVHLGRLAAFYPPCRDCLHRDDTGSLSPLQIRQWAEVDRRVRRGPRFTAEGLESTSPHDVDRSVVRRFAAAVGMFLLRDRGNLPPPTVLVGTDGHWTTADLVAAACEALQFSGCRTLEVGAVTSASLAAAAHRLQTDAALLVGNATGEPHSIGLKLWGTGARPWSSPGHLDRVRELYESNGDRPKRRGGGMERASAGEMYLAPLEPLFHGLRPLRFVLDTRCEPLLHYLHQLNLQAACEVLRPRGSLLGGSVGAADKPFVEGRLNAISQQLVGDAAHFGFWIDGDGERCHLVDERGAVVAGETLFLALASYICRQQPGAVLVLEREGSEKVERALARLGARTLRAEATRQATSHAIHRCGAVFGGGPSGRFWYAGDTAAPDALLTLSLLLVILSQSDRPLSEVLDAA